MKEKEFIRNCHNQVQELNGKLKQRRTFLRKKWKLLMLVPFILFLFLYVYVEIYIVFIIFFLSLGGMFILFFVSPLWKIKKFQKRIDTSYETRIDKKQAKCQEKITFQQVEIDKINKQLHDLGKHSEKESWKKVIEGYKYQITSRKAIISFYEIYNEKLEILRHEKRIQEIHKDPAKTIKELWGRQVDFSSDKFDLEPLSIIADEVDERINKELDININEEHKREINKIIEDFKAM